MSDEPQREKRGCRPSAETPPRNAWITERLARLARKDELLRQIRYLKPEGTEDGCNHG